jgi:hypothetical protein
MVFIDMEKTYNKIPRNVMWWGFEHKVTMKYIRLVKNMYNNIVTSVRTTEQVMVTQMTSRLEWATSRTTLSPYLFALVMDKVTRDIQGEVYTFCRQ